MKKYHISLTLFLLFLTACNDDFMNRFPEAEFSAENFFNTTNDLKLYTNTYYESITPEFFDYVSDNCFSFAQASSQNDLIRGSITAETVSGWGKGTWGELRKYNFFLDNVYKTKGEKNVINHYIGITRLQRAVWYYSMVKDYNDVPWYSNAMTDTDVELLYKSRYPRTLVVDSIMEDLEFAVRHISEDIGNRTQFSKWYAAAMMARICLHEGTFRKYHDELNLQNTANFFLNKAVEAAEIIMNSGKFSIDKTGGKYKAYQQLFANNNLSKSPEMILYKDYDLEASVVHGAARFTFDWVTNYSRSLMESYQYITPEGKAIPFSTIPGYDKKQFTEVFANRDPRLSQTFMYPGFVRPDQSQPSRPNLNLGGYPVIKFMPLTPDQIGSFSQYTDLPIVRYAEILLIYAESKAELAQITQADLDKTINKIRNRIELPPLIIGEIIEDPNLIKQYPNINENKVLLEIRRERRIELVSENFRWDDLMRWKAGHLIEEVQEGIYIDKLGIFDITGDGIPEMGIFESSETNTVPENERENYTFYYLLGASGAPNTFSLTKGNSGHIVANGEIGKRKFIQPKYYYWPIPSTQITLNPDLEQTIFWD